MQAHHTKTKRKHFLEHKKNMFITICSSNSAIDPYTIRAYSLEHKQYYNIVIGKEKCIYILPQVRRDILLRV